MTGYLKPRLKKLGWHNWMCSNFDMGPFFFALGNTWEIAYRNYVTMLEMTSTLNR